MVTAVLTPMFEAADGKQFRTRAAAELHEWRANPTHVEPRQVKYQGPTWDGYANLWSWACGRCEHPAPRHIDTMWRKYSATCEHCNAENRFDFSKYGA